MKGNVNMDGVQEGGNIVLVKEGIHYADITEIQEGITPNGDDKATIKLTIKSGESQDSWIWDTIVISNNPKSPGYKILGRTKHFLHCLGLAYEGDISYDTDHWLYKEVKIRVYHDKFIDKKDGKEKTRAKVAEYLLDEQEQSEDNPFSE